MTTMIPWLPKRSSRDGWLCIRPGCRAAMVRATTPRRVPERGEYGYVRREHDAYWTEPWVTEALVKHVRLPPTVWEPACGRGDISDVLLLAEYRVISTDLVEHNGYAREGAGLDFLEQQVTLAPGIVNNPPSSLAEWFIRHALDLTEPVAGMVCMALAFDYDAAGSRVDLFTHPAFAGKLTLTRRPRWDWWLPPKPKTASPRSPWAWFVWDWRHRGPPVPMYGV